MSHEDVRDYFNGVAPEYDGLYTDALDRQENWLVRRWLSELGVWDPKAGDVVDLGCGTGLFLDLAPDDWTGRNCTSLDISARMLWELKRKHPTAHAVCSDITDAPWRSFDWVVSLFEPLNHLKPAEVWPAVMRWLVPGGHYALMLATPARMRKHRGTVCPPYVWAPADARRVFRDATVHYLPGESTYLLVSGTKDDGRCWKCKHPTSEHISECHDEFRGSNAT